MKLIKTFTTDKKHFKEFVQALVLFGITEKRTITYNYQTMIITFKNISNKSIEEVYKIIDNVESK